MSYVNIQTGRGIQAFEVNALLQQLQVAEQEERETVVELSPYLAGIEKVRGSRDIIYHFHVSLKGHKLNIAKRIIDNNYPPFIKDSFQNHPENPSLVQATVNASVLKFKYQATPSSTRFSTAQLKFSGVNIVPNIYSSKKLCFGQNHPAQGQNRAELLKSISSAITMFLSATFNGDLSSVYGVTPNEATKTRICEHLDALQIIPPNDMRTIRGLDENKFDRVYFYLALASRYGIDLTELQGIARN